MSPREETRSERFRGIGARSVASLLVGLLAAPPAWAAGSRGATEGAAARPTIAVVAFAADDRSASEAARLGLVAERAARSVGRHEVLELVSLLDPEGVEARRAKAEEAKAAFDAARKLYDDLELQKAGDGCDKALQAYERANLADHFDALVAAWILRIASLVNNTQMKAAQGELNLLLPVLPAKTVVDPNLFTPDFISLVKAKREEWARKSDLSMLVDSKPVPSRVFVDGVYRGVSPVEVTGLAPGEHYLTLVAPGYRLAQKRARPGPTPEIVSLEPSTRHAGYQAQVDALKRTFSGSGRGKALGALAKELGVSQVLALATAMQGKDVKVVAMRGAVDGTELGFADEVLPAAAKSDEGAAAFFARTLQTDRRSTGLASNWTGRHTAFVLLGVGLAMAGVGGVMGLQAKSSADDYSSGRYAQTSLQLEDLESRGKTYAVVADVSYVLAAALAGTGLYFLLQEERKAAAPSAPVLLPSEEPPAPAPRRISAPEPKPLPPEPAVVEKPVEKPAEKPVEKAAEKRKDDKRKVEPEKKAEEKKGKPAKREEDFDDLRDDR